MAAATNRQSIRPHPAAATTVPWRRFRLVRSVCAVVICALALAGTVGCGAPRTLPLPQLPPGPIELRVAYVVNPRLPRLSPEQLQVLLAATRDAARAHFGVDLRFTPPQELPIATLFARIPADRRRMALAQSYDFKTGTGDPQRLAQAYAQGFREEGEPLADLIAYVRPYLGELPEPSYAALGAALAELQLRRIEAWKHLSALDGAPALDLTPYNEFPMWLALGYGDLPFELLLTNQLIVSTEYVFPAVHTAIRGGYSNGVTTFSASSRFQTVSVWSTYAYTSEEAWVRQLRAGESYPPEEAARLAGIGAAHEIGHQLFHFLHPFGQTACIMNPVPMFAYRAWAERLSPADCPLGSSAAMRPGAYKFPY